MLLIDVNSERYFSTETPREEKEASLYERDVYLGENKMSNQNLAQIYIGTLAPHFEKGPGDYVLSSLKQMTGTESFLGWSEEKRKCALENYESCQMKDFLRRLSKCGCSPFHLTLAAGPSYKVKCL